MREQAVVPLDRHHRLPRRDRVALVQRVHLELIPPRHPATVRAEAAGGELQDRDRLVDPAQQRLLLLEDLQHHPRVVVDILEQPLGVDEVRVRVIALAQPLDWQPEDVGLETDPRRR